MDNRKELKAVMHRTSCIAGPSPAAVGCGRPRTVRQLPQGARHVGAALAWNERVVGANDSVRLV